jgi:Domain of unknown function (DUF4326)
MPVEGRGLSSRQTQDVVRDLEIGQPNNSEKCSETADGVTRESEGGSRLSAKYRVRLLRQPDLMAALPGLRGMDLICWCAPDPCHADVLLELANAD